MTTLEELHIDLETPGFFLRPDYYDVLGRLRAEAPIFECTPGIKAVSRYQDIRAISRDPQRFCSGRGVLVNDPLREGGSVAGSILHMDPPRHNEWRRIRGYPLGHSVRGRPRVARLKRPPRTGADVLMSRALACSERVNMTLANSDRKLAMLFITKRPPPEG